MNAKRSAILIVDDEEPLREALALALSEEGYAVRAAASGRAALAMHREQPAELILSDVMMPDGSGTELVTTLRAHQDATPVVLMSANAPAGPVPGTVAIVRKPFDLDRLLDLIATALPSD